MTDENDNKPFYRKNWFWITILSIFVIVTATTYIADYSFYNGKADQATTDESKNAAQKKIKNSPSLAAKYDSIKTGKKGFSRNEIIELLGQPTEIRQVSNDTQLSNFIWNNETDNINIEITFKNSKAVAKSIRGLDIDRKKLLTMVDFNKLKDGDSYNRVLSVLGDPDDYSDSNGIKTLTYESDLAEFDPTKNASIKLEISNNQIIYKEQQNLK